MRTSKRSAHTENLKSSIVSFRDNRRRGDRIGGPLCRNVIRNQRSRTTTSTTTAWLAGSSYPANTRLHMLRLSLGPSGCLAFIQRTKEPGRSYGCTANITTPRNNSATTRQIMMNLSRM